MLTQSGIFETVIDKTAGGRREGWLHTRIIMTEGFSKYWDEGLEKIIEARPLNCPISTPPLDWDKDEIGGYPASTGCRSPLVHRPRNNGMSLDGAGDSEETLQAINTLQRTAWRINRPVLEVFSRAYQQEWPDIGFAS